MGRIKRSVGVALVAGAMLAGAGVWGGSAVAAITGATAPAAAPKMLLNTITPTSGSVVGVAMPISVVFTSPVAPSARATIERHMTVRTSVPVVGAWHWFSSTRVDWRPRTFWRPGTKVSIDAKLTGVADGHGRVGVHDYHHSFTIGADFEADVSVTHHTMRITHNGKVVKTLRIDGGSAQFPTWDGTMAVVEKQAMVEMKSCSVGIACNPKDPNFYDMKLPWDERLTYSGTFVHYSPGDPKPGQGTGHGSHGCVHLSLSDAKWYYDNVKVGDPVTITGSPRGDVRGDNGYAAFTLSWSQWLAGSATGAQTA